MWGKHILLVNSIMITVLCQLCNGLIMQWEMDWTATNPGPWISVKKLYLVISLTT